MYPAENPILILLISNRLILYSLKIGLSQDLHEVDYPDFTVSNFNDLDI